MPRHLVARQRLRQIVGGAKTTRHFAIEVGVVDLADHQHADVRLDDMRQIAQCGERLILAADIDHQHLRGRAFLHRGDRGAHAAAADVGILGDEVGQPVSQGLFRARVGDEYRQRGPVVAPRCVVAERLVDVMNLVTTVIRHLSTSRRPGTTAGSATTTATTTAGATATRARATTAARASARDTIATRIKQRFGAVGINPMDSEHGFIRIGTIGTAATDQVIWIGDHGCDVAGVGTCRLPHIVPCVGIHFLARRDRKHRRQHCTAQNCSGLHVAPLAYCTTKPALPGMRTGTAGCPRPTCFINSNRSASRGMV